MNKKNMKLIMKAMIKLNNFYQKQMGKLYDLFQEELKKQ